MDPNKCEWCTVGPGGSGFFWGSHGCTIGDHSEDPHIHICTTPDFDADGEVTGYGVCSKFDDRTNKILWNDDEDIPENWVDYGVGWWQGGKDNL